MEQEKIPLLAFDLDTAFGNFNFSGTLDPTMKYGPSKADLYRLVHKGRNGNQIALGEFADTMYWTLREATFLAFQRQHGVRAILYREWFYYKLFEFFEILLFTELKVGEGIELRWVEPDQAWKDGISVIDARGPVVQLDQLQDAIGPEDNNCGLWFSLAQTVSQSSDDRYALAEEWLKSQRSTPELNVAKRSGWARNHERDQIILNCLNRAMEHALICEELDRLTIRTLPALQDRNINRWTDGWADPEAKNAIQQLFSKVRRRKTVKPSGISR